MIGTIARRGGWVGAGIFAGDALDKAGLQEIARVLYVLMARLLEWMSIERPEPAAEQIVNWGLFLVLMAVTELFAQRHNRKLLATNTYKRGF